MVPPGTKGVAASRPGFPPATVEASGSIVRWEDLGVDQGGALILQRIDYQDLAFGAVHEVSLSSADEILRTSGEPAATPSDEVQRPRRLSRRVPAAAEWLISIGPLPGQISRQAFSASARNLPPPLREWFEQDALLLSVREWRYAPVAYIVSIDRRVEGVWSATDTDRSTPLRQTAHSPTVFDKIWAAWVVGLPPATEPAHQSIQRLAGRIVLDDPSAFSASWQRRASRSQS